MELQTLANKISVIFDAVGQIITKLEELEDKIDDVESQLTANFEGEISDIRSCIGDDIQSAVSEINSNIDQLKD